MELHDQQPSSNDPDGWVPGPPRLPFTLDEAKIRNGLRLTLRASFGDLDLLGKVVGGGTYQQLLPYSADLDAFGVKCRSVTLERLVQLKRAAGRPKDLEALAELPALIEERARRQMRHQ